MGYVTLTTWWTLGLLDGTELETVFEHKKGYVSRPGWPDKPWASSHALGPECFYSLDEETNEAVIWRFDNLPGKYFAVERIPYISNPDNPDPTEKAQFEAMIYQRILYWVSENGPGLNPQDPWAPATAPVPPLPVPPEEFLPMQPPFPEYIGQT